jgi:hypothetical protein
MILPTGGLSGITGGLHFDSPEMLFGKFWPLNSAQTLQAGNAIKNRPEGDAIKNHPEGNGKGTVGTNGTYRDFVTL